MTDAELNEEIERIAEALDTHMRQPHTMRLENRQKADTLLARLNNLISERTRRRQKGRWG